MHIDVNGTRLWFDVDGPALVPDGPAMRQRPTVVLLHGGISFDHSYFKPDFERLARSAQVVYLDMRGLGRSASADPATWNFERCADDVRAFCDALGIGRPIVLGHSMGGFVATLYAARHPDHPSGLVLSSTSARFDLERVVEGFRRAGGDEVAEIARRAYTAGATVTPEEWARCRKLFGPWSPGDDERARTELHMELMEPGNALIRTLDIVDRLPAIRCPILVLVGDLDPITQVADARAIVEGLPDGMARLEVIAAAGHFAWKDQPERHWEVLEGFVREGA